MNTKAWDEYQKGIDYKTRINLYGTVDVNERFMAGDHWKGIPHDNLPTPVFNFVKFAATWKSAAVSDRRMKMSFVTMIGDEDMAVYANQITGACEVLWERLKMDYLTKEGLRSAATTGDYVQYFWWDETIQTGQAHTGDINTKLIDNVNYYPGDPNTPKVQGQPYIILAFREHIKTVKDMAEKSGVSPKKIDEEIIGEADNEYTAGDMGKIELDDNTKMTVLLKFYKKDGKVYYDFCTRTVELKKGIDTKLSRYPIALMNWEPRTNCCHGTSEVTSLIPNQVFINKMMALAQLSQSMMSFPKVLYDKSRIKTWSNKVSGAIPVNGDVQGAAMYLTPPAISYDVFQNFNTTIDRSMEMMGANPVTLGNIKNPDNTSAFIAVHTAASVPLQLYQERFHEFLEDAGLIWLDFIKNFYKAGRLIPVQTEEGTEYVPLPDDVLDKATLRLKLDIGESTMWSEIQTLQTMDNWLQAGLVPFELYLKHLPKGHIPQVEMLLAEYQEWKAQQEMMAQQQAMTQQAM